MSGFGLDNIGIGENEQPPQYVSDSGDEGEQDEFFKAEEIAYQVRYQCHKDRKSIVKKLEKSGQIATSTGASASNKSALRLSNGFSSKAAQGYSNQSKLIVLNEANEPEEEEDTYDDAVRKRQSPEGLMIVTENDNDSELERADYQFGMAKQKTRKRIHKAGSFKKVKVDEEKIQTMTALYGS